jgi:P2-related tail formation protein
MTISKVGRPSISESDVPPHIEEALLHKSRGATWADSATAVGIKYQTLREWVNKNEKAKKFYKEAVQERQEKIQDNLDNAYSILIDEAPTIAKELLKTIKSDKIKSYTKSELFSNYFRIIERGWTDRKMAQQLHETREKIYQLENGRPLELTESPFDN